MTAVSFLFAEVCQINKKSDAKRSLILERAKQVFVRKGFAAVTMKDIIEECGISRGGLYLYFQSVDEIFMQVIDTHNRSKLKEAKRFISGETSFAQLLNEYMEKQKKRLLNLNNSLLIAMYEYRFANRDDYHKAFFHTLYVNTKNVIVSILEYGKSRGEIAPHDPQSLAAAVVLHIEGISMLAVAAGVTEDFIDNQIQFIKDMILRGNVYP
jgi:AcrR family transcriptional regulator